MKRKQDYFRGCLIGGSIGDALGWPVEFLLFEDIVSRYGKNGIGNLILSRNGKAEITDDTQMTLFTAEGILREETRSKEKGICAPTSVVYFAYLRWLHTQGYPKEKELDWIYDGWLIELDELHNRRAPGNSCLSALLDGRQGSIDEPINNSKGCGGVMRAAPAGLFYQKERAFQMAAEFAALTHGHPSGYLSAGALSYIIASIIEGEEIEAAVRNLIIELSKYNGHQESTILLQEVLKMSKSDIEPLAAINRLGEGWIGEEALAISVYCALKFKDDFKRALIAAVNHSGDSDSTGAITGNLLGAYLGINSIPQDWIDKVELKDEIIQIADDLLIGYQEGRDWWSRYPGY